MKKSIYLMALVAFIFAACSKEELQKPPVDPGNENPNPPFEILKIRLQAMVSVGSIIYDSIPAQVSITSWDSNDVPHQKDTILAAGVNAISVPKAHIRFKIRMDKWGVSDSIILNKEQVHQDVVYVFGGSKVPKKLRKEESYLFVMDNYQPDSRIHYAYNEKGLTAVEFYQKKPQYMELQFTHKNLYSYSGSNVSRIDVFDDANRATGFTEFTYNPQGTKITNMHQKSYDVETFAAVEHSYPTGGAEITFDYLYNNGKSMEYKIKIKGGNKVEDRAMSSTGAGEGGVYRYDANINPYAHMNMPNIFLSNISKNNLVDQQKNYSGSIPMAVIYKYEYAYDSDGYPTEVVKHYKGFQTGEHLYKIKTVYTYM